MKKPPKGGFFIAESWRLRLCEPQNGEGPVEPALRFEIFGPLEADPNYHA